MRARASGREERSDYAKRGANGGGVYGVTFAVDVVDVSVCVSKGEPVRQRYLPVPRPILTPRLCSGLLWSYRVDELAL